MNISEQLETIFNGTLFADEVDVTDKESNEKTTSLRNQMYAELKERLEQKKTLRIYYGVDPTRETLHIGHFVPVLKLKQFQDAGHQIIFLIGDYTGQIGDPSGQSKERPRLTHEQLINNAKGYTDQAFKILDRDKTEIRYNGEWLSKLFFADLIEIASIFPLKQIIARRDFQERMEKGESLRFHESLYALMQGYDAYALKCDAQLGGYDQHFNMLAGRQIQTYFGDKPHIMITMPLLVGVDGRKMSKSYGNTINITDAPEDIYGKCMRINDDLIVHYLELVTNFSVSDINKLKDNLKKQEIHPMEAKKKIAFRVVEQYWGTEKAVMAEENFKKTVQDKLIPNDIPVIDIKSQNNDKIWIAHLLKQAQLIPSTSEAIRMVEQGGVYIDGERINDKNLKIEPGKKYLFKVGKRKFAYINIIK